MWQCRSLLQSIPWDLLWHRFTLLFMPSPHCLNAAYIIVSDIKRGYIRSIESLNMKGNERTVSWGFVTLFPLFKKQLIQRIKRRQCTTQYRYSECFHMQKKNSTGQGWQVSDSATQQNTTSNTPFREHTFPLLRYSALARGKDQEEITEIICQRWQKNKYKFKRKQFLCLIIIHRRHNPISACAFLLYQHSGFLGVLPWLRGNTLQSPSQKN